MWNKLIEKKCLKILKLSSPPCIGRPVPWCHSPRSRINRRLIRTLVEGFVGRQGITTTLNGAVSRLPFFLPSAPAGLCTYAVSYAPVIFESKRQRERGWGKGRECSRMSLLEFTYNMPKTISND